MCSCGHFKGARRTRRAVGTRPGSCGSARCLRLHRAPRSCFLRSGCGDPGPRLCGGAAEAGVAPHHTPTFIRTSSAFLPLSLGSQRAKGGEKGVRGARGMGSLTQSNDLRGVEQMVPLTSAAERTRLSGPPARALTSPARPPNASIGPPGGGGLRSEGSPTARLLPSAPCLGRWSRNTRTSRPPGRDGGLG